MFSFKRKAERFDNPAPVGMSPRKDAVKWRAWVVIPYGRVGYIDHYKSDGRFGVRPVNPETGLHYLNRSEHWSEAQRADFPEELSLSIAEVRAATTDEIPREYRL